MGEGLAGNKGTLPCRSSLSIITLYLPERKCQAKNALLPENRLAQGGKKRNFVAIIYYILVILITFLYIVRPIFSLRRTLRGTSVGTSVVLLILVKAVTANSYK